MPTLKLTSTAKRCFIGLLLSLTPFFSAQAQQDAHTHGEAELTIAWASQMLLIVLDTPAYNLFGSAEPQGEADLSKLNALKNGKWLKFVEDINCPITTAEIDHPFGDEHTDGAHHDIEVSLSYHCSYSPSSIDFSPMFAAHPSLQTMHVQWLTDNHQSAVDLTADNAIVELQ